MSISVVRSTARNRAWRTRGSRREGWPSPKRVPSFARAPGLTARAVKRRPGASLTLMFRWAESEAACAGVRLLTKETSPLRRAATAASPSL